MRKGASEIGKGLVSRGKTGKKGMQSDGRRMLDGRQDIVNG